MRNNDLRRRVARIFRRKWVLTLVPAILVILVFLVLVLLSGDGHEAPFVYADF